MQQATDVLGQVEARLEALGHRDGAARVETWSTVSPSLVGSGVALPRDVPGWLWGLGLDEQDRLLRVLVHFAQTGDEPALLVVVACLRPGLLRLAGRTGLPVDDIVVEAAAVVLECPVERRRRVAAGLVMDVRHRFWVAKHTKGSQAVPREPEMVHAGPRRPR